VPQRGQGSPTQSTHLLLIVAILCHPVSLSSIFPHTQKHTHTHGHAHPCALQGAATPTKESSRCPSDTPSKHCAPRTLLRDRATTHNEPVRASTLIRLLAILQLLIAASFDTLFMLNYVHHEGRECAFMQVAGLLWASIIKLIIVGME
jgi:hypothetical protein